MNNIDFHICAFDAVLQQEFIKVCINMKNRKDRRQVVMEQHNICVTYLLLLRTSCFLFHLFFWLLFNRISRTPGKRFQQHLEDVLAMVQGTSDYLQIWIQTQINCNYPVIIIVCSQSFVIGAGKKIHIWHMYPMIVSMCFGWSIITPHFRVGSKAARAFEMNQPTVRNYFFLNCELLIPFHFVKKIK